MLPISVTGTLIPSPPASPGYRRKQFIPGSEKGFTLWEILVVVIIITISISAILFSTSFTSSSADLKILGNDLGKTIRLLYQEAIFENKNYAISLKHAGFQVLEYDGEEWSETKQGFFRKLNFNETQHSNLLIEELVVKSVAENNPLPHILILSNGEMTAFEWSINDIEAKSSLTIYGDILGNILVDDPVPQS